MSEEGRSYKDPVYDTIEAKLEKKHKLPAGIMSSIRTKGERSNSDQVAPTTGARSVYQIIPETRRLYKNKYGVDAYASKEAAAEVAALHLKESFQRGGDWNKAVREYHGGTNPRNWGPQNDAYVARAGVGGAGSAPRRGGSTDTVAPVYTGPNIAGMGIKDILTLDPAAQGDTRTPVAPVRPVHQTPTEKANDAIARIVPGGIPLMGSTPRTSDWSTEQRAVVRDHAAQQKEDATTGGEIFAAAIRQNWLLGQIGRSFDAANGEFDPEWTATYMKEWDALEAPARNEKEVLRLRATSSRPDYDFELKAIEEDRADVATIGTSAHPVLVNMAAGIADPAGFIVGGGIGKVVKAAGIGSRALWASGKPAAAVGSLMGEGAAGNALFTGLLDPHATAEEMAGSALTGAAIGTLMAPFVLRGGKADTATAEALHTIRAQAEATTSAYRDTARRALGTDAAPQAVNTEAARLAAADQGAVIRNSLADIPDEMKLLSEDTSKLLTADPAVLKGVTERGNLEAVADTTERGMIAEHLARAEAMLAVNPIDPKALKTVLKLAGMESTGLRLLASESPIAKSVGMVLLEGTTGAGGRHRTAAMAQAVRERGYNAAFYGFDSLYHQFRKGQGVGIISESYHGKARKQFNSRVYAEIEARGGTPEGQTFDSNPAVTKAADLFERGMDLMRREQQHVGTIGAARLGDGPLASRGYIQHHMDNRVLLSIAEGPDANARMKHIRGVFSEQFQDPANGFDKKFADTLSVKYMEKAMDRARGGYDVPMNLHSPEAADIVRDSLEAMKLGPDEVEKMMGKFSRGGASHTKKRLRLDMSADIGGGMRMQDLFKQDISGLYRSYARRVSGEVALAQYGVMGKKGLAVLRKAIGTTGGNDSDLLAFDQIAAEFLNTPFGNSNHKHMDNLRIATSLSRLGGMGFTQMGEFANGMAAVGVHRTFGAIGALPRLLKEVHSIKSGGKGASPILASIDTLGGHIGLDDYSLSRLFDVQDNSIQLYGTENIGFATRALRAGGNLQSMVSGHRMFTAAQTRGMAEQIVHKAIAYAKSGMDDIALNDMGINESIRAALRRDLDAIATFKGDKLLTLDLSKSTMSGHELMTFRDAVERGASQIIQRTYTGETGKWAHDGFLKLLTQFRTFSLVSVEKQWGRGAANHGALKTAMYLGASMSFAVPIHMARVQAKTVGMSDKERKKYLDQVLTPGAFARATMNYASASGLLGDVLDVGGGFANTLGGDGGEELASMVGARGQGQNQLVGGVIAPGVGMLQDMWQAAHGDEKKLMKALPGANLPYVAPLINVINTD